MRKKVEMVPVGCAVLLTVLMGGCVSASSQRPGAPKLTETITYLRPPNESTDKIVVFIHGLFGNARDTWTNDRTQAYWPQLIIDDRENLYDFAVMVAEVKSPYLREALTIEQAATLIGRRLQDEQVYSRFLKVFFVGHSMGGLIARRIVVDLAVNEALNITPRIGAVLALSTPTYGSALTELASYLSLNPQTRDLSPEDFNTFLQTLTNLWEDVLRNRDAAGRRTPRSYCAYETLKTYGVKVVAHVYTGSRCDERAAPFERDHFGIVKPANQSDPIYQWVATRLLEQNVLGLPVEWGGGRLGDLVANINSAYAEGNTAYVVRFASAEDEKLIGPLWVGRRGGPFVAAGWHELLQRVSGLYTCLGVTTRRKGRDIMLSALGPLHECPARAGRPTVTCHDRLCE